MGEINTASKLASEKRARKLLEEKLAVKEQELLVLKSKIEESDKLLDSLYDKSSQLSIIIEHAPIGIILTEKSNFRKANKSFCDLLGYTAKELAPLSVEEISSAEDYPESEKLLKKMENGKTDHFYLIKRYKKKDDTYVTCKTNVTAVRDSFGDIKYQVALIEDISEQIKSEKLNEKLLHDLENRNTELNNFAHIVSHDLKSPLRSIDTLVHWIIEDNETNFNEETKTSFNMLLNKVVKMENLITGILNYSSIDKIEQKTTTIDVNTIINNILETIHIPEHINISLSNMPIIRADKFRIYQLFQNLISNAIKSINKTHGRININYSQSKKYHQFNISDNGIGIEQKYHDRIFKIFQTLESNHSSAGIGLSIAKKITALYQGNIWFDSIINKGTTFHFTLKK